MASSAPSSSNDAPDPTPTNLRPTTYDSWCGVAHGCTRKIGLKICGKSARPPGPDPAPGGGLGLPLSGTEPPLPFPPLRSAPLRAPVPPPSRAFASAPAFSAAPPAIVGGAKARGERRAAGGGNPRGFGRVAA
uniref:Glutamate decarboxylase 1 n=1 Tax=Anas platyrhynchos platyrhynchos TaxID=8840 RepID=A0A493TXR2_ANAPP